MSHCGPSCCAWLWKALPEASLGPEASLEQADTLPTTSGKTPSKAQQCAHLLEVLEACVSEPRVSPLMLGQAATSRRDMDLTPFGRQEAGLELRVLGAAAPKGVGRESLRLTVVRASHAGGSWPAQGPACVTCMRK